jgi:hypothetical protein
MYYDYNNIILLPNSALDKPATFDISVATPLKFYLLVAGLSAGAAPLCTEESKHTEMTLVQYLGQYTSGRRVLWCQGKEDMDSF